MELPRTSKCQATVPNGKQYGTRNWLTDVGWPMSHWQWPMTISCENRVLENGTRSRRVMMRITSAIDLQSLATPTGAIRKNNTTLKNKSRNGHGLLIRVSKQMAPKEKAMRPWRPCLEREIKDKKFPTKIVTTSREIRENNYVGKQYNNATITKQTP